MKAEEIIKKFKEAAGIYDKRAINNKYKAHEIMALWALEKIEKKKVKILDLGCGTGLSSMGFFKKGHEVVGIDISKEMLQKAKKYPFKKLISQDLEKSLNVEDNEFNVVMLIGILEFIRNPLILFKQIYSKLKEKGIFLITVPKKLPKSTILPIASYSKIEIEKIFQKAKFKVIESKSFFGYYKPLGKKREPVSYYGYLLRKK